MSILVDQNTTVLVQGITGTSGSLQTRVMQEYGTRIAAGVTPGKGGMEVHGIPVYNFVAEAIEAHPSINAAISFVPARFVKDSAMEAIASGIELLVITAEDVPDQDVLDIVAAARAAGITVLGPGTPGLIAPGKCKLGAHPARMYIEGSVGLVSKSGALSYEIGKNLTEYGLGQSTVVGIGGGPIWGLSQTEVLRRFQEDPETEFIVFVGEIGGTMEQEAADFIAHHVDKPVVGIIVGRAAPEGKSLGHAGAIIEGSQGTAEAKIEALTAAGVRMVRTPREIATAISEIRGDHDDGTYRG